MKSILSMTTQQQMEMYKKETGATEIEMFSFNEYVFFKMMDEVENELN